MTYAKTGEQCSPSSARKAEVVPQRAAYCYSTSGSSKPARDASRWKEQDAQDQLEFATLAMGWYRRRDEIWSVNRPADAVGGVHVASAMIYLFRILRQS